MSVSTSTRSQSVALRGPGAEETRTTTTSTSRPQTSRSRPKTAATSTGYGDNEIICAISESRGVSPTVGLSFVNISTSEAVLCQFTDTQTYARICHKIKVFAPTEILFMSTAAESKLVSIITENLDVEKFGIMMTNIDRKYWSESSGFDYVQYLAFPDDLESLKLSVAGNYFAICCFSAVMKYIELSIRITFAAQTLRIKFEPSEGSMMIDLSTIASLELIQNLQNTKSKDCLFGLLNETQTPMGARFLRSNVLQPSTDPEKIKKRQEALGELSSKEDTFFSVRSALKGFVDADRVLASLVVISARLDIQYMEQSINNVLMLKTFVDSIKPIWQALAGANSEELQQIRQLCGPENYSEVETLIKRYINDDVGFSTKPIELRGQRVFAIRVGVNEFLDVARQNYKELNSDVFKMVEELKTEHEIPLDLKFDTRRQFYLCYPAAEVEDKRVPKVFINTFKRGKLTECQTLDLVKMNQKIKDEHNQVIILSDATVHRLIDDVRSKIHPLFKISESIAMLDMLSGLAQLVTANNYIKPDLRDELAVQSGRHPIREKIQSDRFVPNDVFAGRQSRFQIVTGCNMSGKSTYIRSIALMAVMAQIGCFVPATYASFPTIDQLFARVSTDDNIEANGSTFAAEMREVAFILRNVSGKSLVIIDELGRGTSTTDGLAIAIAIAEALIDSKAYVWFVTHFRDLPRILAERAGVVNLHLAVDISPDHRKMTMRYKIAAGYEEEKFYGLALARVGGLPDNVVEVAARVSQALHDRNEARRRSPRAMAVARRRKLILNLREQLAQARESIADGDITAEELRVWLKKLQTEFVARMRAIDADAEAVHEGDTVSEVEEVEDDGQSQGFQSVQGDVME